MEVFTLTEWVVLALWLFVWVAVAVKLHDDDSPFRGL